MYASSEPRLPEALVVCLAEEKTAFDRLPGGDRRNFIRWFAAGSSVEERARRGLILRDALRLSPMAWETRADLPNRRPG